jgi:hypothetical protein
LKGPGGVQIVRIEPATDLAGHAREALVERVALAPIFLTDPVCQVLFVFSDRVDCAVRGPTIDDDELETGVVLIEDR